MYVTASIPAPQPTINDFPSTIFEYRYINYYLRLDSSTFHICPFPNTANVWESLRMNSHFPALSWCIIYPCIICNSWVYTHDIIFYVFTVIFKKKCTDFKLVFYTYLSQNIPGTVSYYPPQLECPLWVIFFTKRGTWIPKSR